MSLCATGLSGARGERILFANLDLKAEAGTALLLRGANGAGKTTLLLMLYGAIRPLAGQIVWSGQDPEGPPFIHLFGHRAAVRARLAVLETLNFWRDANGGTKDCVEALERVGLGGLGSLDAGYLSAGQTRRLSLARLLVAPRPVWLLDEPTAALDPDGDRLVGELMAEHLAAGGLIIAATHLPLAFVGTSSEIRLDG
ncbi:heme ABC exporter ATP-binding protein CcmA [Devosia pacifica]|uniref:heme ABC exporter ATP-binding protein CcmA n=1 Tax=Devosia pacifica TaxID=1335967 RepID=UPI0035714E8F